MPAGLALTGGPAWALISASGLLVAGLGLTGWQLLEAREALGKCQGDKTSHIETATTNREAVVAMRDRLTVCLADQAADARAQAAATETHAREISQILADFAREQTERERLDEIEQCAAWRAGVVCDALADRLRHAAGSPQGRTD